MPRAEARTLGAYVTNLDNNVTRVLKSLLREMPEAVEQVRANAAGHAWAHLGCERNDGPLKRLAPLLVSPPGCAR